MQIIALNDLGQVRILSLDKDLNWWHNFIRSIPPAKQECLKNVMQINHIRGINNGAIAGLGIGIVPRYTVMGELEKYILMDPFPHITPAVNDFNIFIKKKRQGIEKNQLLITYLSRLAPLKIFFQ